MLQTHSAYMLFYERMKVGQTSGGEAVAADISPPDTADGSTAVCRLDADDDDRHKMKIELSPELAEVVDAYSCVRLTTAGHHPPHDTTSQTVSRTFVVTAPHIWNTLPTDSRSQNGPFSGTTRVSRYQKSKTNLDFTEARDSEWQWHQLGHMQVCTSLQTHNHASTPPLSFFTGQMPFLPPNQ